LETHGNRGQRNDRVEVRPSVRKPTFGIDRHSRRDKEQRRLDEKNRRNPATDISLQTTGQSTRHRRSGEESDKRRSGTRDRQTLRAPTTQTQ